MQRCAVSTAPTVIAIISQSLTVPGRITWTTAVQPVDQGLVEVPDLQAEGEPITDAQGRTIAVKDAEGKLITKLEHQHRFFCPDCGRVILDIGCGRVHVTRRPQTRRWADSDTDDVRRRTEIIAGAVISWAVSSNVVCHLRMAWS